MLVYDNVAAITDLGLKTFNQTAIVSDIARRENNQYRG